MKAISPIRCIPIGTISGACADLRPPRISPIPSGGPMKRNNGNARPRFSKATCSIRSSGSSPKNNSLTSPARSSGRTSIPPPPPTPSPCSTSPVCCRMARCTRCSKPTSTDFRRKHRGEMAWKNYTAYEIRIIGAFVRLGKRDDRQRAARVLSIRPPSARMEPVAGNHLARSTLAGPPRRCAAHLDRRGISVSSRLDGRRRTRGRPIPWCSPPACRGLGSPRETAFP